MLGTVEGVSAVTSRSTPSHQVDASGLLTGWARSTARPVRRAVVEGLRFAFYGRVSTEDRQDPVSSRAWQVRRAEATIGGSGVIVAEFFDVGHSRVLPWQRRPQAARLLKELAGPDRRFDAIMIGEYERAFYGNQYSLTAPRFAHHGVQL